MGGFAPALHVVAAVIVDEGRILACRRKAGRPDGGLWEFPGGKVEPGEPPVDALVREILEELGVSVAVRGPLHRETTAIDERLVDLDCYRAELTGAAPTVSTDHDELRWLEPTDLRALDWCPPDVPVVELLATES